MPHARPLLRPPAIAKGDTIGVVSPSYAPKQGLLQRGVRALERAGFGEQLTRLDLERHGFYVCDADLEDELIRALGSPAVEEVLAANGDLNPFRTFQKQPAWRGRPAERQLRRFMGSADSRKLRYARLLVDALPLDRVPRPLVEVLASV